MSNIRDDLRSCLAHEGVQKGLPSTAADHVGRRASLKSFLLVGLGVCAGILGTLFFQSQTKSAVVENLIADAGALAPSLTPYVLAAPPMTVPKEYMGAAKFNNSCLLTSLKVPEGPRTFDACKFIIDSTDEVWNKRVDVLAAIEKHFHDDYLDAGSWGKRLVGKQALKDAVLSEMRAFPDIQIHITDCVCNGNDLDGYKCAMPDILTGTNLGPSGYGPATGRRVQWTGLVQSFIYRNPVNGLWQYYGEWGVHDEWSLIQQLGLDFNRVPHPPYSIEEMHDCNPFLHWAAWPEFDTPDRVYMGLQNPNSWR